MPVLDDIVASVRCFVLNGLPYDASDLTVVAALEAKSASDLLIHWFNWADRIPSPHPRRVHRSAEFAANPLVQDRHGDVQAVIAAIEAGADLTKYLSRGVKHGYVDPAGVKPHLRSDIDLMLSAWGLHHLHISRHIEPDGFVERDDRIIFAAFRPDAAYLIDLMTHQDWAKEHVIRVIVNNWPDVGLVYEVRGVVGPAREIDDAERLTLRKNHVNAAIAVDGKLYLPATAMSSAGTGIQSVRRADLVMDRLEKFAAYYVEAPNRFAARMPQGQDWPEQPTFKFHLQSSDFGVLEQQTGIYIRLGP